MNFEGRTHAGARLSKPNAYFFILSTRRSHGTQVERILITEATPEILPSVAFSRLQSSPAKRGAQPTSKLKLKWKQKKRGSSAFLRKSSGKGKGSKRAHYRLLFDREVMNSKWTCLYSASNKQNLHDFWLFISIIVKRCEDGVSSLAESRNEAVL